MRILFLSAANSIHTVRWVNALSERGHEVVLVSLKNHIAKINTISANVRQVYLPVKGKKGYYLNAIFLKVLYIREQIDVVNAHYASGYGTLARLARLPNVLLSVWGSDVYDFPRESKMKEKILKKNLKYAVQIASTSYCMAEQTRKIVRDKKIVVTPFGVDIEQFRIHPKRNKDYFIVGTVKTLSYKYGIDMIIKAFRLFLDQLDKTDHIHMVIYGEGEQKDELIELCKLLGISDKVHFKGYIANMNVPEAFRTMDIVCFGSRMESESFGVAAVEAMACGCPVIATKVAGFKEVMEEGRTGYLVSAEDYEMMAVYMLKLYRDKELRDEIGLNGRKRVERFYDWNQCVDMMIDLYMSMKRK
ncbi:glycosyltransferase [Schaedlerella arabinosiphila]|uniref:glycosyltransferase n=1 Tax=Schaedlerella arabinosiphila TaxID=2044587 RepID=UPI0025581773|nr:glycosyltransferase [Schaedlerella arabinosiphila]